MKLRSTVRIKRQRELASKELEERLEYLFRYVEKATTVKKWQVLSHQRTQKVVNVRWVVCRILRDYGYSFPEIGRAINRHHSAVLMLLKNNDCPKGYSKFLAQLTKINDRWSADT